MQSSQHDPPAHLLEYTDRIFVQAVDVPRHAPAIPAWTNGFIMLQAADIFDMQLHGGARLRGHRSMAVGPMTRPTSFCDAPLTVRGAAVRLRTGALPRLLQGDVLVDATRDLSAMLGSAAVVADESALLERAVAVLETLVARAGDRLPRARLFEEALAIIDQGPRDTRVQGVADLLGVSTVTLRNAFRTHVGLPPKLFLRVRRMEQVLESLFDNPNLDYLTRIYGFADQSHFIREFRAFCGGTPTEFLARVATPDVREVHNNLA